VLSYRPISNGLYELARVSSTAMPSVCSVTSQPWRSGKTVSAISAGIYRADLESNAQVRDCRSTFDGELESLHRHPRPRPPDRHRHRKLQRSVFRPRFPIPLQQHRFTPEGINTPAQRYTACGSWIVAQAPVAWHLLSRAGWPMNHQRHLPGRSNQIAPPTTNGPG
jgi:hypothetical protein